MNERKVKRLMIQSIRLLTDHPDLKIIKSHIGVQEYEAIQYLTLLTDMGTDTPGNSHLFSKFPQTPSGWIGTCKQMLPLIKHYIQQTGTHIRVRQCLCLSSAARVPPKARTVIKSF